MVDGAALLGLYVIIATIFWWGWRCRGWTGPSLAAR